MFNPEGQGFLRQRRMLLIFSVGILLYVLGGGVIKQAPVISGTVKLTRPWVAELFAGLGFVYALWRYWVYSGGNVRANIWRIVQVAIYSSHEFHGYASKIQGQVSDAARKNHRPKIDRNKWAFSLSRRAKLGVSCRVKVPVGQGLATHPYRVLDLWRSAESRTKQVKRRQSIL